MRLGQAFDPRHNSLNAWRLLAAFGVLLGHSFALTGKEHMLSPPVSQLLGQIGVDGFFAISGFLISGSWLRNPRVRTYLAARMLRLLPGLWMCLIVTGFVIAPVAMSISDGPRILGTWAPVRYFFLNFTTVTLQGDIGGTPQDITYPLMWNGSLWTLQFEVLCYLSVIAFGLIGLLKLRWFFLFIPILALIWSAVLAPWTPGEVVSIPQILARFALMFFVGAALHRFRNYLPANWTMVAICAAIVLASSLLPNYRLVAAVPLAYLLIASGALVQSRRLAFKNDLSYGVYIYAWPIQQMLVISGLSFLHPLVFTAVVSVPIFACAALSWFFVEKPALSLKSRIERRSAERAPESLEAPPDGLGEPAGPN